MGYATADLLARVEEAVDRTIQMAMALPSNGAGAVIGRQIVRSSGSVGANIEEAQPVITRKDYTNRISLSLREARETLYWMRRIENNKLLSATRLGSLKTEWNALVGILTATQKNLRRRK